MRESKSDSKAKNVLLKKREIGIASAMIVVSQAFTSFQGTHNVNEELRSLKDAFQQSQIASEKYLVKKTDVAKISDKLETMNDQLIRMNEQIKSLKAFVRDNYAKMEKSREGGYSLSQGELSPAIFLIDI